MVYIIVLSYNQWSVTADCIASLLRLSSTGFRIIVVDNGSTDGSPEKLQGLFRDAITLIGVPQNLGFTGGNNLGIRFALKNGADYILLLNNDTIVDPDFLSILVDAFDHDNSIAAVNPKIYFLYDRNRLWATGGKVNMALGLAGNRGRGQPDNGQFDKAEAIDYGTGCCLLIKREALEIVGLLNNRYFAYFEDVDWSLRAKEKGFKIVYVPAAKIWHAAGVSSKGRRTLRGTTHPTLYFLTARNHLWFLKTHTRGWQRATSITGYLLSKIVFYSIVFLALGRIGKLKALWRGFSEGLAPAPDPERVEVLVPSLHSEV